MVSPAHRGAEARLTMHESCLQDAEELKARAATAKASAKINAAKDLADMAERVAEL